MPKIEFDLTEEQIEKVETLKESGIDIGQAIDMLYEVRQKLGADIDSLDDEEKAGLFDKVRKTRLDVDAKTEMLEENYSQDKALTPEMQVVATKRQIRWAKDFFKL